MLSCVLNGQAGFNSGASDTTHSSWRRGLRSTAYLRPRLGVVCPEADRHSRGKLILIDRGSGGRSSTRGEWAWLACSRVTLFFTRPGRGRRFGGNIILLCSREKEGTHKEGAAAECAERRRASSRASLRLKYARRSAPASAKMASTPVRERGLSALAFTFSFPLFPALVPALAVAGLAHHAHR